MPQRLLWVTDPHLNFVTDAEIDAFAHEVVEARPSAVLLGGDVGEADSVVPLLERLAHAWTMPIYFVLGNHDFYRGSIRDVRRQVGQLASRLPQLIYLTQANSVQALSPRVGLVGHDGWADARSGDYVRSLVMMNDYLLIDELKEHSKESRWQRLMELGDEAAEFVEAWLPRALQEYEEVYLLTHVPPFREACWYDGRLSDDEWAPHFTCMAVGHAIDDVMRRHPQQQLTVLCGHTHGAGLAQPLPNVRVETGAAEYGRPAITKIWEID